MIFVCERCGSALSNTLQSLDNARLLNSEDGADFVPMGFAYFEVWPERSDVPGHWCINLQDAAGMSNTADASKLFGCCGPSGSDGPNQVCDKCGEHVAIMRRDCWLPHHLVFVEGKTRKRMSFAESSGMTEIAKRIEAIGCPIEFAAFALDDAEGDNRDTHREAAVAMLYALRGKTYPTIERLIELQKFYGYPEGASLKREDLVGITIDPNALGDGIPVSKDELLGPYCSLERKRVLFRGKSSKHLNDLFWFGDEETSRNRVEVSDSLPKKGLSGAYHDPPYGLFGERAEHNALFFDMLDHFFDGMQGSFTIFAWSDEASSYFDDGKEWWGTYFWTVHRNGSDRIVGVAASTTD
jgi:hypothetical protein